MMYIFFITVNATVTLTASAAQIDRSKFFFFFLKGCSDNHEIHRGGFKQSATQKNQIARCNPLADNSCQALK
jgi:hypothetical protein